MDELTTCCHKIIEIKHPYYLCRRPLKGETFGEWFEYLAKFYNFKVGTVWNMYESFRKHYLAENNKTLEQIQYNNELHEMNSKFEESYIKAGKDYRGFA